MSCCCCVTPGEELLEGTRKKERLLRAEEEPGAGQEEESRRNMDITLLREQYRCTRETQRRHTQVLLFRTVSQELSEAISVIPVTQGLLAPWKPNSSSPPAMTFDPNPTTYDPWHVHLGLHRRSGPGVAVQLVASSWRSSSTSDPPCSSFNSTKEEDCCNTDRSRGHAEKTDPVQVSVSSPPEQTPSGGFKQDPPDCSSSPLPSFDESSTPVSSITSLHGDLKETAGRENSNHVLQNSRKFSSPALRFTRQLSVGGMDCSSGVHQNQNYHPFPNRKTPRVSDAARKLGMYSSF